MYIIPEKASSREEAIAVPRAAPATVVGARLLRRAGGGTSGVFTHRRRGGGDGGGDGDGGVGSRAGGGVRRRGGGRGEAAAPQPQEGATQQRAPMKGKTLHLARGDKRNGLRKKRNVAARCVYYVCLAIAPGFWFPVEP